MRTKDVSQKLDFVEDYVSSPQKPIDIHSNDQQSIDEKIVPQKQIYRNLRDWVDRSPTVLKWKSQTELLEQLGFVTTSIPEDPYKSRWLPKPTYGDWFCPADGCDEVATHLSRLHQHIKRGSGLQHEYIKRLITMEACPSCKIAFRDPRELMQHDRSVHGFDFCSSILGLSNYSNTRIALESTDTAAIQRSTSFDVASLPGWHNFLGPIRNIARHPCGSLTENIPEGYEHCSSRLVEFHDTNQAKRVKVKDTSTCRRLWPSSTLDSRQCQHHEGFANAPLPSPQSVYQSGEITPTLMSGWSPTDQNQRNAARNGGTPRLHSKAKSSTPIRWSSSSITPSGVLPVWPITPDSSSRNTSISFDVHTPEQANGLPPPTLIDNSSHSNSTVPDLFRETSQPRISAVGRPSYDAHVAKARTRACKPGPPLIIPKPQNVLRPSVEYGGPAKTEKVEEAPEGTVLGIISDPSQQLSRQHLEGINVPRSGNQLFGANISIGMLTKQLVSLVHPEEMTAQLWSDTVFSSLGTNQFSVISAMPLNNIARLHEPFRSAIIDSNLWRTERRRRLDFTSCLTVLYQRRHAEIHQGDEPESWKSLSISGLPKDKFSIYSVMHVANARLLYEPMRSQVCRSQLWRQERAASLDVTHCVTLIAPRFNTDGLLLTRLGQHGQPDGIALARISRDSSLSVLKCMKTADGIGLYL